ncbi:MAG: hypothetical protein M3N02_05185 [Pseudomonadota bacterium]|nr:hypothetical protein [Pseudomonadota bacterium]
MLIALLLASEVVVAAPSGSAPVAARTIVQRQEIANPAMQFRKRRLLRDSRDLVERAQSAGMHFTSPPGESRAVKINAAKDRLKAELDSVSEISEMDSLRLQMALDRLSKAMSTLSNLLEKTSATDDAITNNMK